MADYIDAKRLLISIINDPDCPFDSVDENIIYAAIGTLEAYTDGEEA